MELNFSKLKYEREEGLGKKGHTGVRVWN
jgi:hypothetical protein